jgi:hypothetical protein
MSSSIISSSPTIPEKRALGRRLITQNVLTSAAYFEYSPTLDWESIQDLSTFIDMFCLYDKVTVLGRAATTDVYNSPSDFFGLLRDMKFVEVENPSDEIVTSITDIATKHLATFLGEDESDRFQSLFNAAFEPSPAYYGLTYKPDRHEEIQVGKEWLLTTPTRLNLLEQLEKEQHYGRGATFLVRTFLYLAYADALKITLTPDAVRSPVLETVLAKEESYRADILSKFKGQWETYPTRGEVELRRSVSPFAAIVFNKAASKSDIPQQMAKLRYETEALRKELQKAEDKALWWTSRDEAVRAERKWNEVLAEIEVNFGADPRLVTIKRGLNFAESVGGVIEKPHSPKSWIQTITGPVYDIVSRFIARGPAVEIHALKSQLQSPNELRKDIESLFGKIQET